MKNHPLYIAMGEMGIRELPGRTHNPTILKYADEAGFSWVSDDETPWCSIFVSWCCMKAETVRSRMANARSWLNVGVPAIRPEPGDVVVFWRGRLDSWQGHVGFFLGYDHTGDRVFCLGGNQANQVSITSYPSSQVLGFRRLGATGALELPSPTLRIGDRGRPVRDLQDALKLANYDCGTSDGIFGKMTERAVKLLQSTSQGIEISDIYDEATRSLLENVLMG